MRSKNKFYEMPGWMTHKRERDGQAFRICNDSRPVGLLDSAPIVFWAGTKPEPATPSPSFEADLLRIDGNSYVVKDIVGVERQVHVGKDPQIFGQAKARDRIQLWGSAGWTCSNDRNRHEWNAVTRRYGETHPKLVEKPPR